MNAATGHLNLVFAWLGVVAGFVSGVYLGVNFHRPDWLGGYGSFQRRLYRLAHISFFGLAIVNFMFYLTARQFSAAGLAQSVAASAFVIGAISMPLCCILMAHFRKAHALFAIPVISLLAGGLLTVWEVLHL